MSARGDHSQAMGKEACPSRILVVDDHPIFRQGFVHVLSSQPDIEVVGEAKDGLEAIEACQRLRPDLVVMDLSMPMMDGVEATREVKEHYPNTVVLVVTAHANEDLMLKAIRAGAAGYVLKEEYPMHLIGAVRETLRGEFPINQGLATRLLRRLAVEQRSPDRMPESASERHETKVSPPVSLSPRELEVLTRVVEGKSNRLIAQELHMSLSTMKRHLERIASKLGVSDRTQVAVKAIEMGLLPQVAETNNLRDPSGESEQVGSP